MNILPATFSDKYQGLFTQILWAELALAISIESYGM